MHPQPGTTPAIRTQRRRALLLGCGGGSLRGVHNSLAVLQQELAARRFATAVCGPSATADEVLVALATFTRATRPGDAVVVVYVGHGMLLEHPDHAAPDDAAATPRYIQALVPVDHAASTAGDCRAITSLDLGLALRHLAARADNVTLVLDCCHAAGLASDVGDVRDPVASLWNQRLRAALGARLGATRSDAGEPGDLADVVRLVGSAAHEHAYEEPHGQGGWIGVMSRALAEVLAETRDLALAWTDVAAAVHARVHAVRPQQWVGLEGPRTRGVFTRAAATSPAGGYPCAATPAGPELPAGRLHGVRVGDRFAVISADGVTARVVDVAAVTATTARLACDEVPIGARAVCVRHRRPVGALIHGRDLGDVAWLRGLADRAGCTPGARELAAHLRSSGGVVCVVDPDDSTPLLRVRRDDHAAGDAIVGALQRLATWRRVRAAFVHASAGLDAVASAARDGRSPRPLAAGPLTNADTLQLRLSNRGRLAPLIHFAVFRVTGDRTIVPLTRDAHGVPLQVGETWDLGHREFADDRGLPVVPALPGERCEWLLVVGQPAPLDVHWLETAVVAPPVPILRGAAPQPPWCAALPYRVRG